MKNSKAPIIIGAGALVAVGVIVWLTGRSDDAPTPTEVSAIRTTAVEGSGPLLGPATGPHPTSDGAGFEPRDISLASDEEGTHYYNDMDPELQPRTFYTMDFTHRRQMPAGFEADGVVATPQGFQLAPLEPGEEPYPRQGTVLSPVEAFEFPANALSPLWMEDIPEGTDLMVEMQVSPDGEHWGPWQYIAIDNDSHGQIEPFYPDGSPNPNYGYTPGGLLVWGDLQFTHMRYRMTFFSENEYTPTVDSFRGFYMDSTMGDGRIATVGDLEADLVGGYQPPDTQRPSEEIVIYNPGPGEPTLEVDQQTDEDVSDYERQ